MAITRNIQMQYFNGTDYDTLYPTTTMNQVSSLNSTISGIQSSLNSKLNISGGTMTGNLVLSGDPTSSLMAASKQYVDSMKTTIQDDIFFDKLLEKEFAINFVFDGGSRSPSSGNTNTGLDTELKDIINSSAFFITKLSIKFNNVTGEPNVSMGFSNSTDVLSDYSFYNRIDSIIPNSQMIISTFNGMTCYLQGDRMSYITNKNISLTANKFTYLKADVYDPTTLNITGTLKITFYGIN